MCPVQRPSQCIVCLISHFQQIITRSGFRENCPVSNLDELSVLFGIIKFLSNYHPVTRGRDLSSGILFAGMQGSLIDKFDRKHNKL